MLSVWVPESVAVSPCLAVEIGGKKKITEAIKTEVQGL